MKKLEEVQKVLSNKAKYINEILDDVLDLRKKKKEEIFALLEEHNFDKVADDYKYLIKMPMDSVCIENVDKLLAEKSDNEGHIAKLKSTTNKMMWMQELQDLQDLL
jgi:hypothetical protein